MTSPHPSKTRRPFLSLPPFPRRRLADFALSAEIAPPLTDSEADVLIDRLAETRVGGTYWGAQPDLGRGPYVLVREGLADGFDVLPARPLMRTETATRPLAGGTLIRGECDPWHLLNGAAELHCQPADPLRLIAGIASVPVRLSGEGGPARLLSEESVRGLLREALGQHLYLDPFGTSPLSWMQVVELCAGWRRLVDSNRDIAAVYGLASWKRATTEPLLWDGSQEVRFDRQVDTIRPGEKVACWKSRTPAPLLAALENAGATVVEVEDGFIRSVGLGANCVPPQSIVVDDVGAHFDARSPSRLEQLMQEGNFPPAVLARANALRSSIKALGISKYNVGHEHLERRCGRLHVLVPGQVEDDRAVLCTPGRPISNLDLLTRVRASRPEAHIIYKPHPDVEAGHRKGAIADAVALGIADEVVRAPSISSWIDIADEVHVNSSLAGFEALLRDTKVTTYGVPFYAGWGLTEDLGPVPTRRTAQRTVDELVAATLIVYPRYVDPVTNLPCSPEVLIARLSAAPTPRFSLVSLARRLQGQLMRHLVVP
jgi:capsular polysaccharide export protein